MTPLLWLAAAVMIVGAILLVVGVGAPALWIAVITVGIAIVVITQVRSHHTLGS
jgi:hypothetical protein